MKGLSKNDKTRKGKKRQLSSVLFLLGSLGIRGLDWSLRACLSSELYSDELTGRRIVYYRALSIIVRLKTGIKFGYGKSIILLGSCNPLVAAMFLLVTTSSQLAVKTYSYAG